MAQQGTACLGPQTVVEMAEGDPGPRGVQGRPTNSLVVGATRSPRNAQFSHTQYKFFPAVALAIKPFVGPPCR
jgi:hypothetical protein